MDWFLLEGGQQGALAVQGQAIEVTVVALAGNNLYEVLISPDDCPPLPTR